jgi:long-chain acyl-CoA synthetase
MNKIWMKNYMPGVPAEIDLTKYNSIAEIFDEAVAKYSSRVAYVNMGRLMTYKELDKLASQFGAYLQNELKLPKGARVAIMMPNVLQYPVCLFGALKAGYVVVNCNPLYTARELAFQLKDSGAEAIVILENFAHVLEQAQPEVGIKNIFVTSLGEMLPFPKSAIVNLVVRKVKKMVPNWNLPGTLSLKNAFAYESNKLAPAKLAQSDIAFLQYTGGTTGVSKGAMLTHGNIVANLQQAQAWLNPLLAEEGEIIITALPLYHIFALTANCLTFLKIGAMNVLITNPRDIPGFVKEMSKYKFTTITGVNTLFNALVNSEQFKSLDFSRLKISLGGGMAVQKAVAEKWKAVTGKPLIEAYGLTETSPAATINPLNIKEYNGAIGLPLSSTEVAIRSDEGQYLPVGEIGEICIRGPQVMKGYWNRPDETSKVLLPDGYLLTGDIGYINDEGYVFVVDRKKDMILVSGFNVYPNEIEAVVALHPGVLEVAAIGVPDEKSNEVVKIFVVKKEPSLTAEEITDFCRKNLTAYKVPKQIEFRSELPKTNVGKILRRALR